MRAPLALIALLAICLVSARAVHAWPEQKSVSTQTYALSTDGSVAVENGSGDVNVETWDRDDVQLTVTKTALSGDDLARIQAIVEPRPDLFAVSGKLPDDCFACDISLDLRVPHGAHVTVRDGSGDVSIDGVRGPVRADTGSGDIEVSAAGDEVRLHSGSGDITVNGDVGPLQAETSSGDIEAKDLQGDADIASSSGAVTASFSSWSAVKKVRLESSSGDVAITVPRGAGFRIAASTTSGGMTSNLRLPIRERDSGADVSAQVGDGSAMVQMVATSGDVDVKMR